MMISFEIDTYKKRDSPGIWTPDLLQPNRWPPIARHACDAAWPVFLYPYRPTVDDIVGLRTIFFMCQLNHSTNQWKSIFWSQMTIEGRLFFKERKQKYLH